jgi:hypothetical protein
MLLPDELVALAEWRREAIEREIRLHQLLSQAPRRPALWRQWSGGSLMWAGAMLVQWGEGVAAPNDQRGVELLN